MSIEAMKLALEALQNSRFPFGTDTTEQDNSIRMLVDAIEQAQKQEPVADSYALADKVREALDRHSCPDAFMRIAWEAVTKHYTSPPQRQPLEGVIDVKPIGYHSLQLVFDSQDSIERFKAAHGIKEKNHG